MRGKLQFCLVSAIFYGQFAGSILCEKAKMMRVRTAIKSTGLGLGLIALSACGGDDKKEIIFDTAVGPETKSQISSLPKDLRGDSSNRRHAPQTPPEDMEPSGSGGGGQ